MCIIDLEKAVVKSIGWERLGVEGREREGGESGGKGVIEVIHVMGLLHFQFGKK